MVLVPPILDYDTVTPSNLSVVIRNSLFISCPMSGIPPPKITWYKNGEVISPELDPNIRTFADGRRLELTSARVTDTGLYRCEGVNVAGSSQNEYELEVYGRFLIVFFCGICQISYWTSLIDKCFVISYLKNILLLPIFLAVNLVWSPLAQSVEIPGSNSDIVCFILSFLLHFQWDTGLIVLLINVYLLLSVETQSLILQNECIKVLYRTRVLLVSGGTRFHRKPLSVFIGQKGLLNNCLLLLIKYQINNLIWDLQADNDDIAVTVSWAYGLYIWLEKR